MSTYGRLEEMIHFICSQFKNQPEMLGSVKLNKICWFSDVDWFFLHGASISGDDSYIKQPQGPVLPDILPALTELHLQEKVAPHLVEFTDYKQWYYEILAPYNKDNEKNLLNGEQIKIIETWCNFARKVSAAMIIRIAHDYPWWDEIQISDVIPISYGAFIRNPLSHSKMSN